MSDALDATFARLVADLTVTDLDELRARIAHERAAIALAEIIRVTLEGVSARSTRIHLDLLADEDAAPEWAISHIELDDGRSADPHVLDALNARLGRACDLALQAFEDMSHFHFHPYDRAVVDVRQGTLLRVIDDRPTP